MHSRTGSLCILHSNLHKQSKLHTVPHRDLRNLPRHQSHLHKSKSNPHRPNWRSNSHSRWPSMGFLLFFWPRGRCAARPRSVAGGTPGRRSSRPRSNCRNAEGCPRPRGRRPGCPRPRRRPRRPRRRCPRRRCARPRPPGWARRWPSLAGSSTHYTGLRAASSVRLRATRTSVLRLLSVARGPHRAISG